MSVTALHIPYKKDFEPIVIPEENIAIAKSLNSREWEYYKVKYIEPFFIKYTTPTISNGDKADIDIEDLELHKNVVAQIRVLVLTDGFEVEVRLPEATKKYSTKNVITKLDKWISDNLPNLTEIFYMGDEYPKFTVYNNSGADGSADLRIVGFKYIVERLNYIPDKYTVIYVSTVIPS